MKTYQYIANTIGILLILTMGVMFPPNNKAQEAISVDEVLDLLSNTHNQYESIHAIYQMESGELSLQHEVWLDSTYGIMRHEVTNDGELEQLTVSDSNYVFLNPGPMGDPMTVMAPPVDNEQIPFPNQLLGGIGTLISPYQFVEGRLSEAQITVDGVELFNFEQLENPLDLIESLEVAKVTVRLAGFPPLELWIDVQTGVIVKETVYDTDGTILSQMTLQFLELNPELDSSLFRVDASQYNPEQLDEAFPPVGQE